MIIYIGQTYVQWDHASHFSQRHLLFLEKLNLYELVLAEGRSDEMQWIMVCVDR